MKPDWEKEAEEYAIKMSAAPDKECPSWIMVDFKAGCNHVYETLVKPLQEENREIKYQIDDLRLTLEVVRHKKREQVNLQTQDLVDQIAALKEENERLKNLTHP